MRGSRIGSCLAVGLLVGASVARFGSLREVAAAQDEAAQPEFYTAKVAPIFQANCARCHGGLNHRGGLNMDTRAGLLKGGHDGAVIIPGDPEKSLLVRLMRHQGPAEDPMPMPPAPRAKVSDADIDVVARWVRAGAAMPADVPKP